MLHRHFAKKSQKSNHLCFARSPPQLFRLGMLGSSQPSRNDERSKRLRVARPVRERLLQIRPRALGVAAQEPRDAARGEEVRRGEGGVAELLGVERVRGGVRVFAGEEGEGGLDELEEQVVFGPAFGAVEFFLGEVGAVDGEVYLDDGSYAVINGSARNRINGVG